MKIAPFILALSVSFLCAEAFAVARLSLSDQAVESAIQFWQREIPESKSDLKKTFENEIGAIQKTNWLEKGPHRIEKTLSGISLVASGRKLLSVLIPLWLKGELTFLSTLSKEAKAILDEGNTAGFYYRSQIFTDDSVSLIALVGSTFHEATHAEEYLVGEGGKGKWKAIEAAQALRESDEDVVAIREAATRVVVQSEHRAYLAQNQIYEELIAMDSDFKDLIRLAVDNEEISFPVTQKDIRSLLTKPRGFNFPETLVDRYLPK